MSPVAPAQQALVALLAARGNAEGGIKPTKAKPAAPPSLPPALRPWQAVFGEMAVEHVAVIARLMAELQPLIEEPEHAVAKPRGELEAYDGIATKGEMDRLLSSQWLWRDLHEPEFLRRLAESELVFHHIRQRDPSQDRAMGVVIDAGPWMLGRPRLVALAALLCLGRQAHAARMPLFWRANGMSGVAAWQEGFDRDNVRQFLTEVSAVDLSAEQLQAWFAAPPDKPAELTRPAKPARPAKPLDMQWYVVAPRRYDPASLPKGVTQILVAEQPGFDAEGRFGVDAEVTLETPAGRRRSLVLPLPAEAAATALLREPFPPVPATATRPEPALPPDGCRWAQHYFTVQTGAKRLLVAVEGGVIILRPFTAPTAYFLPIRPHETLLGLLLKEDDLITLRRICHADHCKLIVEIHADMGPARLLFELRLPVDHPLGQGRFPANVMPMMGRPGSKPVFWVYAPSGQPFEVSSRGVRPCGMLARCTIVKALCDYVLVRRSDGRISLCSLRANNPVAHFFPDIPKDAAIDPDDILCNLDEFTMAIRRDGRTWTTVPPIVNGASSQISLGTGERLVSFEDAADYGGIVEEYWICGIAADGGLFYQSDERNYVAGTNDFRFDVHAHPRASANAVFAEHGGKTFAERILTFDEHGDPMIIVIADRLAEAACLRD
ncbi:hypothetical protein [Labrys neptuniae]